MANKNEAHNRRVSAYLKPKNHVIFKAYAKSEEMTNSECVNNIMNSFFNQMSPQQKQSYLNKARNINQYK